MCLKRVRGPYTRFFIERGMRNRPLFKPSAFRWASEAVFHAVLLAAPQSLRPGARRRDLKVLWFYVWLHLLMGEQFCGGAYGTALKVRTTRVNALNHRSYTQQLRVTDCGPWDIFDGLGTAAKRKTHAYEVWPRFGRSEVSHA